MAKRKNPLQQSLSNIPAPLKSRYVVVILLFAIWMIFFAKFDVFTQVHLEKTKNKLQEEKEYYDVEMAKVRQDKADKDRNVEKFAREKHHMKRSDEDVFVIVEEEE
ncbi:MAG: hypothetical protein AAGG68_19455 [Bacteroidota bacterium]